METAFRHAWRQNENNSTIIFIKNKIFFIFIMIIFTSFTQKIYSQGKLNVSAGIGLLECLNIGMHYQFNAFQVGMSAGTWPNQNVISILGDLRLQFGQDSKSSNHPSWYLLYGLDYVRHEDDFNIDKNLYGDFRVGRYFYILKEIGIDINIGIQAEVMHKEIRKKLQGAPIGGGEISFLPGLDLSIFFNI